MEPLFVILVLAIIGLVFIFTYFFSKKAIIKRKLKKSNLKNISEFKDGDVARIVGKVEIINTPLLSPLTNRKCSYFHVLVEQEVSSGKSTKWETIIEEKQSNEFIITKDDNYAFINDSNIKSYVVDDATYKSGFLNDPTEHLENYLSGKGYKSENFFGFNKTLRYKEGVLEEGEEIAVLGRGEWKEASELNLPEKYGKILEITSNAEDAVYLSDDPVTTIPNPIKNEPKPIKIEITRKSRYRK